MASGIHSTIADLQNRLFYRWVPKWHEAFSDSAGGFYERLGKGFKPVLTGQRRLVTQCRQLSIYSDYVARGQKGIDKESLKGAFDYITSRYWSAQTGLWHFSLNDTGQVQDDTCDLYALSFVIFSFSHYFRATGDVRAMRYAADTLKLIDTKFRQGQGTGLAEAINQAGPKAGLIRRQNPHMHLLEACLFAYETWKDSAYLDIATEMTRLFTHHFYDINRTALVEFFEDDLKTPHVQKGAVLEPGHYFEWVWLLKKYEAAKQGDEEYDAACLSLLNFANQYGWDSTYGGIYDGVDDAGHVIADTKRIWPFCEALKANALMLEHVEGRQDLKDRVAQMVDVFREKYMQERGFWTEWLNRDLSPAADYMPGTTPYHVYFGITETMDVLNGRGQMKSLGLKVHALLYKLRRRASSAVRDLRLSLSRQSG
jgi:mannose-6-phosphate isomerase